VNAKAESAMHAPKVEFAFLPGREGFPLLLQPALSGLILTEWIKENMALFNQKLSAHGAILLRGFKVNTTEKLQHFIGAFNAAPLEYRQRSSPRYEVAKNIYHSTTHPPDQHINMHSENSYALSWAMRIIFCCVEPARAQGETPIADNRLVLNYLSPGTRDKFREKGVRYVRNLSKGIGLSWEEAFQTSDRAKVEAECTGSGMEFSWEPDERLKLRWNNQAIHRHPHTGEEMWFNHAFFFNKHALSKETLFAFQSDEELPFQTYYGDGSEISAEEVEEIRAAYEKATVLFPWQKGDVLFLDNMLTSHGRRPYQGDRKIIVSML
jgi:alpha-ketoglutarate-dependent taurine dioxygenase